MARPTRDDLAHAAGLLEELAMRHESRNNPNGWADLYAVLDLLVWVDTELDLAKKAAAYGPGGDRSPEGGGTIGANTIGRHGLSRPVEARFVYPEGGGIHLNDTLVKNLSDLRRTMTHQLGQLRDDWRNRCTDAANWPMRTEQAG